MEKQDTFQRKQVIFTPPHDSKKHVLDLSFVLKYDVSIRYPSYFLKRAARCPCP